MKKGGGEQIPEPFRQLALRREKQMPSISRIGEPMEEARPGKLGRAFHWKSSPEGNDFWNDLYEGYELTNYHYHVARQQEVERYELHWEAHIALHPIGGSTTIAYLGEGVVDGMYSFDGEDLSYNIIAYDGDKWYGRQEYHIISIQQYIHDPEVLIFNYD